MTVTASTLVAHTQGGHYDKWILYIYLTDKAKLKGSEKQGFVRTRSRVRFEHLPVARDPSKLPDPNLEEMMTCLNRKHQHHKKLIYSTPTAKFTPGINGGGPETTETAQCSHPVVAE